MVLTLNIDNSLIVVTINIDNGSIAVIGNIECPLRKLLFIVQAIEFFLIIEKLPIF